MATIQNGANIPLNTQAGTVPNMGGALLNWFQPQIFTLVAKVVSAFQVVETPTNIQFMGVVQPLSGRQLMIKPEGQRNWNWIMVHSQRVLPLKPDDVIIYLGVQYRVMSQKDYMLYSYMYYELVEDYTASGPPTP